MMLKISYQNIYLTKHFNFYNMKEKKYFSHETAVIDKGCSIGKDTKIWHFSHIMKDSVIAENCNIGQNVVISPNVILGDNVKVQN